MQYKASEEHQN